MEDTKDTLVNDPALDMYKPWLQEVTERLLPDTRFENVSAEQCLAAQAANHQRRTFGKIPRQAGPSFLAAVTPALQVMAGALTGENHDLFLQALRCFMIVPQFALVKSDKTLSAVEFAAQITGFIEGPRPRRDTTTDPAPDRKAHAPEEQKSDLSPNQLRALRRAKYLAAEGRFSKATQAIQQAVDGSSGVLDPNEDVLRELQALHPPQSAEPLVCPDSAPSGVPIVTHKLLRAGNRISNGSAPDIFGWTGELVRFLLHDTACRHYISQLVSAIRDGNIPGDAREWLLLSWLVAINKGNGKLRPIAGGTILVKLASTYLMEASEQTRSFFRKAGIQCGVFMPDGAVVARHFTQLALETNPNQVVLKLDYRDFDAGNQQPTPDDVNLGAGFIF